MFALVESGSITQFPNSNKGITIGDNQYPQSIYTLWTEAERNAIGIYTVIEDNSKKKSEEFYINTNQTISYDDTEDEVTASYGNATAKLLNDENAVAGQFVSLLVIQDGTGSRTLSFNAVYEFTEDTAPTLTTTASKGDLFVFRYNGSKFLEVGRNLNLTLS